MQSQVSQQRFDQMPFAECSSEWREDSWFYALRCGVRVKGSNIHFSEHVDSTVYIPPQIGFIFLLKGTMSLELGQRRYHFEAGAEGCCIMISLDTAENLRRIARAGEINEHIGLSGLELWLREEPNQQALSKNVYKESVRSWPMTLAMHQGCLQWQERRDQATGLQRDMYGINLLEIAWRHFIWLSMQSDETYIGYQRSLDLETALKAMLKDGVFDSKRLAEGVNMSLRTLQRRAKQQFGCTLKEWLSNQRMLIAQNALIENGVSISEAAWLAGYNHSSSFIQAFKKSFKVTPKIFLAQQRVLLSAK